MEIESQKTQFYNENIEEINELETFLKYVLFILTKFPLTKKAKNIITTFLKYFDYMIDIALENAIIYDIYHFKKECNIYGDYYQTNEFLSQKFNLFYSKLLLRCKKKKYLSLEMLKYIHQNLYEKENAFPLENYILINNFYEVKKENMVEQIFDVASIINKYYLEISFFLNEINFENRLCSLENTVKELIGDLKIDKYYDSFFNIPGELSLTRRNVKFILDRIIKTNSNSLDFHEPNLKIIKKSFFFIENLIKNLDLKITDKNKSELINSIKNKLNSLKQTLTKYQNFLNRKSGNNMISSLNPPLINLTTIEKQFLQDNIIHSNIREFKKLIKTESDRKLQIIIDYLSQLKDIGDDVVHLNDKETIKYYSFSKKYVKGPEPSKGDKIEQALEKLKIL